MITAPTRATLIVTGQVIGISNRFGYDREAGRRTSEVVGQEVAFRQQTGSTVLVRYSNDDVKPEVLRDAAVVVEVQESREFGVFLNFSRNILADDLDRINSSLASSK